MQLRRYLPVLLITLSSGCVLVKPDTPDDLDADAKRDIVVVTKESKTIELARGNYQIVGTGDSRAIQGKGRIVLNKFRRSYEDFSGTILFSDITSVEKLGPYTLHWSFYVLIAVPVAYAILYASLVSQHHGD